jgi:aspartyl-tRNA(Asn)/glutamyl-tRNA(Gln) amidotransferase subunit A
VKRRIMLGTYALSAGYYDAYYGQAQKVRTLIKRDFEAAFEQVDLIAAPVAPTTAFRIGEHGDDPLSMYLEDVFTLPANLAGLPGLTFPVGFDQEGLPTGMQLMGPAFREEILFKTAHAYQQATDWHTRTPLL